MIIKTARLKMAKRISVNKSKGKITFLKDVEEKISELHDCKKCHGKIVLIEVDSTGNPHGASMVGNHILVNARRKYEKMQKT